MLCLKLCKETEKISKLPCHNSCIFFAMATLPLKTFARKPMKMLIEGFQFIVVGCCLEIVPSDTRSFL